MFSIYYNGEFMFICAKAGVNHTHGRFVQLLWPLNVNLEPETIGKDGFSRASTVSTNVLFARDPRIAVFVKSIVPVCFAGEIRLGALIKGFLIYLSVMVSVLVIHVALWKSMPGKGSFCSRFKYRTRASLLSYVFQLWKHLLQFPTMYNCWTESFAFLAS